MVDFVASMIMGTIMLIICAFALYASIISFSLLGPFKLLGIFIIVISSAGIIISIAAMIFSCHEFFSE